MCRKFLLVGLCQVIVRPGSLEQSLAALLFSAIFLFVQQREQPPAAKPRNTAACRAHHPTSRAWVRSCLPTRRASPFARARRGGAVPERE